MPPQKSVFFFEVETPGYFCHFRKGEKGVNAPVIIFGITLRINRVLY